LSEDEFLRDLDDAAPKDLAKSIRRQWPLRGNTLFAERYRPLADLAAGVAEVVADSGVTVSRGTRLADLPAMFERHKVVTLVAHWCFADLRGEDISSADGFRALLAASAALGEGDGNLPDRPTDTLLWEDPLVQSAQTATDLAAALNRLLAPGRRYYEWVRSPRREVPSGESATAGVTRVLLEELYPRFIVPGRCLELADRLCTVWEFIEQVPPGFDGIVDMTVCNSIIAVEPLRRRRAGCNAITNTFRARAEVRLEMYRHAILSLAEEREPFEEVAARAHRLLRAVLQNPARIGDETEEPKPARVWTWFVRAVRDLLG
jgi:hypothetical protein